MTKPRKQKKSLPEAHWDKAHIEWEATNNTFKGISESDPGEPKGSDYVSHLKEQLESAIYDSERWTRIIAEHREQISSLQARIGELEQERDQWKHLKELAARELSKMEAAYDTIDALQAQLQAVTQQRDELMNGRIVMLCDEHGFENCSTCNEDTLDAERARLIRAEARLRAQLAAVTRERDALRISLIAVGRNLGCLLTDAVSTDFLGHLPEEAALNQKSFAQLQARNIKLREALQKARQHMLDAEFDPECIAVLEIEAALTEEEPQP